MKEIFTQFAQRIDAGNSGIPEGTADDILLGILTTVYGIAGVIAVIVIIIAGISFINSGGDSSRVAKAKNQILYSVIGIIFIMAAFAITNFVIRSF